MAPAKGSDDGDELGAGKLGGILSPRLVIESSILISLYARSQRKRIAVAVVDRFVEIDDDRAPDRARIDNNLVISIGDRVSRG
jgi:hypothetical protein